MLRSSKIKQPRQYYRLGLSMDIALILLLVGVLVWFFWFSDAGLVYTWRWKRIVPFIARQDADGMRQTGLLIKAMVTTIRLACYASIVALVCGGLAGIFLTRQSSGGFGIGQGIGRVYVLLFRNLPVLLVIYLLYFFFGALTSSAADLMGHLFTWLGLDAISSWWQGITMPAILSTVSASIAEVLWGNEFNRPNLLAGALILGFYEGAYVAEIVRAGIQSVNKGQWEAASSLGLAYWQCLFKVVVPQAFAFMLPMLAGQMIATLKDTSILSIISMQEITMQGRSVADVTKQPFEVFILIGVFYLCVAFLLSWLGKKWEKRLQRRRT